MPTDGSERALRAARIAVGLAARMRASLTVLYVTLQGVPGAFSGGAIYASAVLGRQYEALLQKQAVDALDAVKREARGAGVPVSALRRIARHPWRAILAVARERECDLVVMASHGRGGAPALLLGSETTKVLAHSKIPVLVCR